MIPLVSYYKMQNKQQYIIEDGINIIYHNIIYIIYFKKLNKERIN